ncbi:MAG: hypothetical protein ACYC5X_02890, partial [Syntrophales bacterium]
APARFPNSLNSAYFRGDLNQVDWLSRFPPCNGESFARGALKGCSSTLILDEPTNHLNKAGTFPSS